MARSLEEIRKLYDNQHHLLMENWAISKICYDAISELLPIDSTILELGSGIGTELLNIRYNMISIEENKDFINKHPSTYIYAPLRRLPRQIGESHSWYDWEIIDRELNGENPKTYDLILIDGPAHGGGRRGLCENLHLFDTTKPIVFDDADRKDDRRVLELIVKKLDGDLQILSDKQTAIILPKKNK